MDDRQVERWRQNSTEALREYFLENGYLTCETPLTAQEICLHVLSNVADDLGQGCIDELMIDRIVGALPT